MQVEFNKEEYIYNLYIIYYTSCNQDKKYAYITYIIHFYLLCFMYMELLNSSEASFDNTRNETISLRISHKKKFGTITGSLDVCKLPVIC